jgi:hypothetical protein
MESDFGHKRLIPNEDVYFYCKRIDNSRVARESDPRDWRKGLQAIAICFFTACALAVSVTPYFWGTLDGYKIMSLKQEQQRLRNERVNLDSQVAQLLSPARLEELARTQQFIDPSEDQVVYLNPKPDGKLAMRVPVK